MELGKLGKFGKLGNLEGNLDKLRKMGLLIKPHTELHNKCQTGMIFRSTKLKRTSKCQWMSVIMIYGACSQITMRSTPYRFSIFV